jgi:bacteriocin biosynthesis cyclodehydratase domain-containing protein
MPIPSRPQIKPGLRRVRRDASTVQIGLSADAGVLVAGLDPAEAALLDRLDGTQRSSELTSWAGTQGVPAERVGALLDLLDRAGVLTGPPTDRAYLHRLRDHDRLRLVPDAHAWSVVYPSSGDGFRLLAERTRHTVLLVGRGRLARTARGTLRRTGVRVEYGDRLAHPVPPSSLVVLLGEDAVSSSAGAVLLNEGRPHLAVVAGADRASVGPLVVPGRSACLRCLELHRTDRDPAWPSVAAQLAGPTPDGRGESAITALMAGLLALQVTCWVDGQRLPASVGATVTVTLPDGLSTRRTWPRHPACGCAGLAAAGQPQLGTVRSDTPTADREE